MNHSDARAQSALKTITAAELLAYPFPDRFHLVEPWLRDGESCLLWADAGLGKTMLALTVAAMVAGGGAALGWRSPAPRPILYVDGEMHAQDLRDRLKLLVPAVAGLDADAMGRNLHLLSRQLQAADVRFPDLADAEGVQRGAMRHRAGQDVILREAQRVGAKLLILDNLSTLADLEDENDAAAMTPVLGFLLRLKQAGIACIAVHHSGKSGLTYRGSSKLATTFECIMGLHKLDGRSVQEGTGFELKWGKLRGTPSAATRDAEVILEGAGDALRWIVQPGAGSEIDAMLDAAATGQFGTQRELAAHLGWDAAKVSRLRGQAILKGKVTQKTWEGLLTRAAEVEDF